MSLRIDGRSVQGAVVFFLILAAFLTGFGTLKWGMESIDLPLMYLQHVLYGPLNYFISPQEYQLLSTANVTPWSSLSFGITYELFGLDPFGARLHHLLSYVILITLISLVSLRLAIHPLLALTSVFFLITSDPFIAIRDSLICRHYLEGMIAALCSLILYERFIYSQRLSSLIGSVLFFLVSLTAKEVYAPLPALLFFVGSVSLTRRIFYAIPFAIVCVGYLLWRAYMLGSFGGYGASSDFDASVITGSLLYGLNITTGSEIQPAVLFGALVVLSLVSGKAMGPRALVRLVVVLVCAYLPFLFLGHVLFTGMKIDRWGFVPIVVLTFQLVSMSRFSIGRFIPSLLTSLFAVLGIINVLSGSVVAKKPHLLAAGHLPSTLLRTDGSGRAWNFMGGEYSSIQDILRTVTVAHWSYLNTSVNNDWGFFPLRYPPQTYIHDFVSTEISGGQSNISRWRFVSIDSRVTLRTQTDTRSVHFELPEIPSAEECYLYVYSKNNGIAIPANDCKQVSVTGQLLNGRIRSIDNLDEEFNVLAWGKSIEDPKTYWLTKPTVLDVPGLTGG